MKYALVTGSSKGIGYAIAKKLLENGYYVFLNGRSEANFEFSPEFHSYIKADLSTLDGVNFLANSILQKTSKLDSLILNAGATSREPFGEVKYEDWAKVMDTNVNMPFFIVQNLRNVIADSGSIIFIGSDMGIYPHSVSPAYSVSKAAVHILARSLVKEFATKKIRVNAIAPGFIDTEWQKSKPEWLKDKIEEKIALKRFGNPNEIAEACLSLIDNEYVNGTVLNVDGGYDYE